MSHRAADDQTEALLADYIDGRLTPDRRRELDSYFLQHPREKEVIDQLATQRRLLRESPGERAPADIYDEVAHRLERSALLSDLSEMQNLHRPRSRFRPRWLAMAAMLLLSGGLVATVFLVVSPWGGSLHSRIVAMATGGGGGGGGGAPGGPVPGGTPGGTLEPAKAVPPVAMGTAEGGAVRRGGTPSVPGGMPLAGTAGTGTAREAAEAPAPALAIAPAEMFRGGEGKERSEVHNDAARPVVLLTSDVGLAQERVERFLRLGGWSFQVDRSGPDVAGPAAAGDGSPDANNPTANAPSPSAGVPKAAKSEPSAADGDGAYASQTERSKAGSGPQGATLEVVSLTIRVEPEQREALRGTLERLVQAPPDLAQRLVNGPSGTQASTRQGESESQAPSNRAYGDLADAAAPSPLAGRGSAVGGGGTRPASEAGPGADLAGRSALVTMRLLLVRVPTADSAKALNQQQFPVSANPPDPKTQTQAPATTHPTTQPTTLPASQSTTRAAPQPEGGDDIRKKPATSN
jgi:hypothetical protein